uniref:Uncharacterized protein n=1 Tax=Chromera velia CCMP2878 TaxID=1169474 RepID=A0A0G4GR22_9ALVE|eukprot:Cvel_22955.t1-p1 / transcript=Cvel_22955.t1 / gene=Cvel_22955 / organism=Chromera_velia_CCMP2878 / gene_product=Ribonuclease P protein subunit p29, putative / transcript_product=Ribonuclease P protein subunit p29, putative / location=Cvel_scaffold2312:17356-19302(-) / protein_length=263 / sequence_SO=supercontig / SO=protein_coding / is_pseudo=false
MSEKRKRKGDGSKDAKGRNSPTPPALPPAGTHPVYAPLHPQGLGPPEAAEKFLLSVNPKGEANKAQRSFLTQVAGRPLRLDNIRKSAATVDPLTDDASGGRFVLPKVPESRKPATRLKLSNTEIRRRGLHDLDPSVPFSEYEALHQLWSQYATDLIADAKSDTESATRLLGGDLHGAILTVESSKVPSLIGASGILLKETEQTFQVISRDNRLRILLKEPSVFAVQVGTRRFLLHGQHFLHRAAMRSKVKPKARGSVQMTTPK